MNIVLQKARTASAWAGSKVAAVVAIASAAVVTSPAFAAAIDVSAVVDDIEAQAGPVGLIGGAVLLLTVAIAAFMWVRKAVK